MVRELPSEAMTPAEACVFKVNKDFTGMAYAQTQVSDSPPSPLLQTIIIQPRRDDTYSSNLFNKTLIQERMTRSMSEFNVHDLKLAPIRDVRPSRHV